MHVPGGNDKIHNSLNSWPLD